MLPIELTNLHNKSETSEIFTCKHNGHLDIDFKCTIRWVCLLIVLHFFCQECRRERWRSPTSLSFTNLSIHTEIKNYCDPYNPT